MLETVGIVVRIHEGRHSSKEIKEDLRKLGLNKKYDAVFMKLDEKNIKQIQCKFEDLFLDAKFKKIFYNKPKGWIPDENPFVAIEELKDPNDPKAPKEKKDVKKVKKQGGNKTRRNYKKKYRLSNKRKV